MRCSRVLIIGASLLMLNPFSACSKSNTKNVQETKTLPENKTVTQVKAVSPEVKKAKLVYSKMSGRFKNDIQFKDDEEIESFIADLNEILEE